MENKHIYLSVDLDYWSTEFPIHLFEQIVASPLSKIVVVSHEELLPHINSHVDKFDTLVNVDYHSDLASFTPAEPTFPCEEGTWANFIDGSKDKTFIWSPPDEKCKNHNTGYCHGYIYPNPFGTKKAKVSGWKLAKIKMRFIPPLSECVAVGISLSPLWSASSVLTQFSKWLPTIKDHFEIKRGVKASLKQVNIVRKCGPWN